MTISRVGSVSDKRTTGSLQFLLPSVADGDAMVIYAECSDARTFPNPPTGTVNTPELRSGYPKQGGTNARAYMWRVKLMAADSGEILTIAPDANNKIAGWVWIGHSSVGYDLEFIDDEDYESKAASDVNYNAPASTSTVAGDWALVSYGTRGTDPTGFPASIAGLTKLQEQLNIGTGATGIALYDSGGSIGGASTTFGPKAAVGFNSGAGFGVTILVKEQAAASAPTEFIRVIPIVPATSGGGGGPSPLLVPDAGAWFGVCHNFETLTQYETRVGRTVENQEFHQWGDIFPTSAEQALTDVGGRITLFNWKMNPGWPAVASGAQDAVIDAAAARFIAWGKRFLLAPHHEPENNVPSSGTPADYRAAFRRVVTRLRAAGATNAIIVWKVMGGQFNPLGTAAYTPGATGGTGDSVWPGDDVVDWVMYDPYNPYGCTPGGAWRTFEEIADPSIIGNFSMYDHSATNWPSKPLGIAETGTNEHDALQPTKATWFTEMLSSMKTNLPRIRGMWYFHAGPPTFCERYIHTSPEAQAAMVAVGADPYFNPTRPTF